MMSQLMILNPEKLAPSGRLRVVRLRSENGKPYFVVQEQVTPQGHYITWQGIHATEKAALNEMQRALMHRNPSTPARPWKRNPQEIGHRYVVTWYGSDDRTHNETFPTKERAVKVAKSMALNHGIPVGVKDKLTRKVVVYGSSNGKVKIIERLTDPAMGSVVRNPSRPWERNPGIGYHRQMRQHYNELASKDLGAGHKSGADYWLGAAAAENRSVASEMREGMFEKNPSRGKPDSIEVIKDGRKVPVAVQRVIDRANWVYRNYPEERILSPMSFVGVWSHPDENNEVEWVVSVHEFPGMIFKGGKWYDRSISTGVDKPLIGSPEDNIQIAIVDDLSKKPNPSRSRSKNPCTAAKKHRMFHDANPDRAYKVMVPESFPKKLWMLGKLHAVKLTSGKKISGGIVAAGTGNTIYLLDTSRSRIKSGRVAVIEYDPVKPSKKAGPVYYHPYDTPPKITRVKEGFYIIRGPRQKLTSRGIIG